MIQADIIDQIVYFWLNKLDLFTFCFITFHTQCFAGSSDIHKVVCVWPLTWRAGCHEEGATWFGGPWFSVSAGAFSATSSPSGLWGLHISLPFSYKDYKKNTMLSTQRSMVGYGSAEHWVKRKVAYILNMLHTKARDQKTIFQQKIWMTTKMSVRCCKMSDLNQRRMIIGNQVKLVFFHFW